MRVFQISSELNVGSVGRIAEQIGEVILAEGGESFIAYGRESKPSKSFIYKIGNKLNVLYHVLYTRITDRHGFASKHATRRLIRKIKQVKPDLIQLQHVHGYFIHIGLLFEYLKESKIPVVWTFHDCWSFTGHCAYYEYTGCEKWKLQCFECPLINTYPKSIIDNSEWNFKRKRELFTSVENLTIVPVSNWLGQEVNKSFLRDKRVNVIRNGIDLEMFKPSYSSALIEKHGLRSKYVILGVANPWSERKGLQYFIDLSVNLGTEFQIVLIGLNDQQLKKLPSNIIGLKPTERVEELAEYYSLADVFVNPTLEEALGMTNIEAQACGTPVVTFRSGGAPETISESTGIIVEKGDTSQLLQAILEVKKKGKDYYSKACVKRAEEFFNKVNCFNKYIKLYKDILERN
ncbi:MULTISPECIES: glycosyltransferase [unclassified Sphingobacterium]|uniref:glycosyltransferase n=1 Tax=unclassified Sphingobacterium TaxID=2609468 RepID=UPI0025ECA626|nr:MULTISPECIES: glycosyltransferase [unclassified Sphingobacterium]